MVTFETKYMKSKPMTLHKMNFEIMKINSLILLMKIKMTLMQSPKRLEMMIKKPIKKKLQVMEKPKLLLLQLALNRKETPSIKIAWMKMLLRKIRRL